MSAPQLPHAFATDSGSVPASQLDDNFSYLLWLLGNAWDLVSYFGIPADGSDQTTALNNAFAAAKAAGRNVTAPAGVFGHTGNLIIDSIAVVGAGDATEFRNISTGTAGVVLGSLYLIGTKPALKNVLVTRPNATARTGNNDGNGVNVGRSSPNTSATDYQLENVHVVGASGTGFFKWACTGGTERNCSATNTQADGNHTTKGSSKITIWGHVSTNTGDDGVAVVSYQSNNAICTDIKVIGCSVYNGSTRGLSVVGGQRIQFESCNVNGTQFSGIYIASEAAYSTYGCEDILVLGNVVENACQSTSTAGGGEGALTAIGQTGGGTAMAGSLVVALDVHDVLFEGNVVRGAGPNMRAGIWVAPGSTRVMARNTQIANLRKVGSGLIPDAISLDGSDSSAESNTAYNIGGSLISTLGDCVGKIRDFNNRGRLLCQDVVGTTNARNFVGTGNAVLHSRGGSQYSDGLANLVPFASSYSATGYVVEELRQDDTEVVGNIPQKALTIAYTGSSLTLPTKAKLVMINGGSANTVTTLSLASHEEGDLVTLIITDSAANTYNLNPGGGFVSEVGAWNANTNDVLQIIHQGTVWRETNRIYGSGKVRLHEVTTASAPLVGGNDDLYEFTDGDGGRSIPARRRTDNGLYDRVQLGVPIKVTDYQLSDLTALTSAKYKGRYAYCSNARKAGEGAGAGTGCMVWNDGTNWRTFYDNTIAAS